MIGCSAKVNKKAPRGLMCWLFYAFHINPRCSAQDLREGSYAEYRGFYLIFPELYTTLRFDNKCIKTRIVEIAMGA